MPLDTFIAGAYASTYNAVATGITEDGYRLRVEVKGAEVAKSDVYGDTLLDYAYRGGNASIMFDCLAYKPGSINPFMPWATLGLLGVVGKWASDQALPLVLTAQAGTSAGTNPGAPASITAAKAIVAPNYEGELLYNSVLRKVPIKLQFLPYVNSSNVNWFVQA